MKNVFLNCVLILFFLFLVGCTEKEDIPEDKIDSLTTPTNFLINENLVYFDQIVDYEYTVEIINDSKVIVFTGKINDEFDLTELGLDNGDYQIRIKTEKDDLSSDYTNYKSYTVRKEEEKGMKEIKEENLINTEYIHWLGRTKYDGTNKVNTIYHTASGFEILFKGKECKATIQSTNYSDPSHCPYICIVIDGDIENGTILALTKKEEIILFQKDEIEQHIITVYKITEAIDSTIALKSIIADEDGLVLQYNEDKNKRVVEVFGDSTAAGYGNLGLYGQQKSTANTNGLKDFIFQAVNSVDAEAHMFTASGWGVCGSIWTTPKDIRLADYYDKITVFSDDYWDYTKIDPDLLIFSLGTNDMYYINEFEDATIKASRLEDFIDTYVKMIKFAHDNYPYSSILIVYGAMGEKAIYDGINEVYNRAKEMIESVYLLELSGDKKGIDFHPSLASHNEMAQILENKIKEIMGW